SPPSLQQERAACGSELQNKSLQMVLSKSDILCDPEQTEVQIVLQGLLHPVGNTTGPGDRAASHHRSWRQATHSGVSQVSPWWCFLKLHKFYSVQRRQDLKTGKFFSKNIYI
uniref:Uncharacterized protein n=1 Tax=Ficedula albicollis TaxID=59894 RepID=A0A803VQ03_FICAL